MMLFFSRSLSKKLILLVTAVSSLTVLLACAGLGTYQWHHARNTLYEQESTAAQITADSSAAALLFDDGAAAAETLGTLRNDPRILAACLFSKAGAPAGAYVFSKAHGRQCPKAVPASGAFTLRQLAILKPVNLKNARVGTIYFEVSLAELNRLTVSLAETALLATLAATLFALLLSTLTEGWISRPVVELTRTAVQIANGGSNLLRARSTSTDEVGILVQQFNTMLDRLHEREAELRSAHGQLEAKVQERTKSLQDEIAERKMVELDLSHAKNLAEEANRAKSSFLANMSHELRTPLNAIIGYSEMLWEDAQDPSQKEMRGDLSKILFSARHLLGVISDVLDLSKIEAGQMKLLLEDLSVQAIIHDVLPIADVLVRNKNNHFCVENALTTAMVRVDPLRFRQCLLNLLSNASKFTEHGTITLQTELCEREGLRWVVWHVRDTGIGIAPASLSKLFQSFSQVDESATRRHGGTGLGLRISQELCKSMNGSIEVQSEVGTGSVFSIWLPCSSGHDEAADTSSAGASTVLPSVASYA